MVEGVARSCTGALVCRVAKMKAEGATTKEKVEKLTEKPVNCVQEGCAAKPES